MCVFDIKGIFGKENTNCQSFSTPYSIVGHGELVPISSSLRARGGVCPGQVASPSQGNTQTTMHTPKGNLERPINLTGMSLDCVEEARVPGENPHIQRENMQAPCRKTPSWESNPGPSCCKATVLPTAPPCSPNR
ncbi:hypothetical protein XENOCAPTIV_025708 [Xenoophorus captivus]|uniref:Uncharacterized protein n=1 Tax=Xenoophorus captivus TaxID=1517983 RepID=A0ABV0RDL6_9TELE